MCTPVRSWMAATASVPFAAIRRPAVPTAAIARTPCCLRLVDHARDRGDRALERGVADHALLREPLAEARQLRAVDDGAPAPREVALADVELDRIGAGVDDRVAFRLVVDQGRQRAGIAGVRVAAQAEFPHGPDDPLRILGLDGDGAGGLAIRHHLGQFGRAAADRVAGPPLVDLTLRIAPPGWAKSCDELVQRVARAGQPRAPGAGAIRTPWPLGSPAAESPPS